MLNSLFNNKKWVEIGYKADNLIKKFDSKRCKILLFGQVQSGKTQKTIEIIEKAVKEYNYNYVFFIAGTNNLLVEQAIQRVNKKIPIYSKIDYKIAGSKCVFGILKHPKQLNQMKKFIIENNDKKILIIDDESDFYSIDTNHNLNNHTIINKLLEESYSAINPNNGGILSVSGTPYANLLNSKNDEPIKYIFASNYSEDYCGIDFFDKLKNDFYIIKNFEDDNDYLRYSIKLWIIKTYLFFNQNYNQNLKSQLLVNINVENNKHEEYKKIIRNNLLLLIKNENNTISEFKKIIENLKILNVNSDLVFEFLKKEIVPNYELFLLNAKSEENIKFNNYKFEIIIGGVLISRGVTFENLITMCFLNSSEYSNADTLIQRMRWLGYRKINNRYKYMNVVTNESIYKNQIKIFNKYNNIFIGNNDGGELRIDNIIENLVKFDEELKLKSTDKNKKY